MTLSDGDKEQIAQAADTYFAQIPDEEQKKLGITRDTVYHFYEKLCLTDLYYEKKTKDEGQEISDEDARVIKVMYIYFKTGEKDIYGNVSPYEESKVAAIKEKALGVLDQVNQGGDFQSFAAEYSDSSEYQSVFGRGTMQESFEEAQQEAEEAAKLTVNDVADGTTLETLKDAITLAKAVESAPACPASGNASDFTKATDDIRKYADNLRNITNELDAAVKSVVASQELRLESAE